MPVLSTLGAATAKAWGFLQQVAAAADPYFNYVTMLLTGNGTNGAQNNTFLDSSTNAFSITRNGNTTQGSFSPYGNLWSVYFNGNSSNYIDSPNNIALGAGDFTVEGWMNPSNTTSSVWYDFRGDDTGNASNDPVIQWSSVTSGKITVRMNGTNAITSSSTFSVGVWYHVALVRSGTTVTLYVNGTSQGTYTTSTNFTTAYIRIGAYGGDGTSNRFTGYSSNMRAVTGTAVYTTTFTPPTTPLTAISGTIFLACQSNRFIDNSSNNYTITVSGTPSVQRFSPFNPTASYNTATIGGSGYFDGTGDYLTCSNTTISNFGTGSFTYECWVYKANNNDVFIYDGRTTGNSYSFALRINSSNYVQPSTNGSALFTSSNTIKINAWNHIVYCRGGTGSNQAALFINGARDTLTTDSTNYVQYSNTIGACSYMTGDFPLTGYMGDLRIVKGSDVYGYSNSTITVPSAPLTAITNTTLLLNYTNAGIPDSAMMNDLETVGNAQVSTSVKKFGTGSVSFDNSSGTYLKTLNGNAYISGTEDFTIEGWIYLNSTAATQTIISGTNSNSLFLRYGQGYGTTQGLNIGKQSVADCEYCAYTFSANTWYYITVTRTGGNVYFFVNGVKQTTAGSGAASYSFPTATQVNVGYFGAEPFNGYMDDFRITKGYARYTATFTPPSQALPTY